MNKMAVQIPLHAVQSSSCQSISYYWLQTKMAHLLDCCSPAFNWEQGCWDWDLAASHFTSFFHHRKATWELVKWAQKKWSIKNKYWSGFNKNESLKKKTKTSGLDLEIQLENSLFLLACFLCWFRSLKLLAPGSNTQSINIITLSISRVLTESVVNKQHLSRMLMHRELLQGGPRAL